MSTKFSSKLKQYNIQKGYIKDYAKKKSYSVEVCGEFSATFGIPLYFVYYYYWKEEGVKEAKKELIRLLRFYQIEFDLKDDIDNGE